MKQLTLTLLLVCAQQIYAQSEIIKFPLPEGHKQRDVFSAKLDDSISLHLAISENGSDKNIEGKPFIIKNHSVVLELNPVVFNLEDPQMVSAHLSDGILTILYKRKEKRKKNTGSNAIYGIDIDIHAKTSSLPKLLLNDEDKTIIVTGGATYFFEKTNNTFTITKIGNTKSTLKKEYHLRSQDTHSVDKHPGRSYEYIKTDEFINIGSLSTNQIFKYGSSFYVTSDNTKLFETQVYELPFTGEEEYSISSRKYSAASFPGERVTSKSFLTPDYLFTLLVGKKEVVINIFDVEKEIQVKQFTYTKDHSDTYHEYYYKDTKATLDKRFIKSFSNPSYIPAPFITVNKTIENGYLVEAGNVNSGAYQYNPFRNDWMWQQQDRMNTMMRQHMQQTIKNIPSFKGFGPNVDYDIYFVDPPLTDKIALKLSLDSSLNASETLSNSIYEYINYDKTINVMKAMASSQPLSYIFFDASLEYIIFQKSSKSFVIRHGHSYY